MTTTGAAKILTAALTVAEEYRPFSATKVIKVCRNLSKDDPPSRQTVYAHLNALIEPGAPELVGSEDNQRQYRLINRFDPSQ